MSETKSKRSLANIASIVAAATLISKVFGLVRQQAIAAAFAVGPVADAYNFAYVIPGFLLVLLGGINGPFHSAIVSVVAKRKREDIGPLIESISTLVTFVLLGVAVGMVVFAGPIIDLVAQGLDTGNPTAIATRAIAIRQLQIMAPMAIFAGLIGIGFGTLNADDQYWLPSVSPMFSSIAVIIGLGLLYAAIGSEISRPTYFMVGGAVLAGTTLLGAVMQWLVQLPALWRSGLGRLRLRFNWQDPGVRDVFRILVPATISSGMMQINVFTDLFFASYIPATAAALGYANLLVQTPLGIISNVILVPFLPIFARLAAPENWPELKDRIRQSLMMTALTMLPLGAFIMTLALPIVQVVYERGAFDLDAAEIVTAVLVAYGLGMFVYLARDVLVRVYYALGDAQTPFRISLVNIGLNAVLDYFFIRWFGAPGLVLATVGVNIVSTLAMVILLDRKLNGIPWLRWGRSIVVLTALSGLAGLATWGTRFGLEQVLGMEGFINRLVQLAIAGVIGLAVFSLGTLVLRIPEATLLVNRIKGRFMRR
ncbi:murein biosynthesis integral membrane protein MurJ [Oscillatoria sp. CS-180]|uniref:murein biosynthesis integral membrane protein MurJ n=1 Tax=Oscillatoria sp. CS-180 TaxID=3021720 RepID=UPI00232FED78|nr:murein biosynthesis integral membrane protein MurJ [Oscillatoria sp. CS-180]MDB9525932.1 murein biosynthesis integral membrane protein MurJ [Oscillatoria sp. CS-180]